MHKLAVLFSHGQLNEDQTRDAAETLDVPPDHILYLPDNLQALFSSIPPELPTLDDWIAPIKEWLGSQLHPLDYVLIQGDFGVVVSLVDYCREQGWRPLYSTTHRQVVVEEESGKKISIFKHVRYRLF